MIETIALKLCWLSLGCMSIVGIVASVFATIKIFSLFGRKEK